MQLTYQTEGRVCALETVAPTLSNGLGGLPTHAPQKTD